MDFTFQCPKCGQEFVVDHSLGGTAIDCPSCAARINVPPPPPDVVAAAAAPPPVSPAGDEKHFVVPLREGPTEVLIQKPKSTLEVAREERDKKIRLKTIRRQECVSVDKDHFDEVVSEFLQKVGKDYIISVLPITYTYADLGGSKNLLTDYGVMIVFRG
ncbi:MAG TPA: hypothetical protein PKE47_05075 [Verrucomicrobiota bacterium]|nr:hypothetical protein [Verrucomicrobiota bacterium]